MRKNTHTNICKRVLCVLITSQDMDTCTRAHHPAVQAHTCTRAHHPWLRQPHTLICKTHECNNTQTIINYYFFCFIFITSQEDVDMAEAERSQGVCFLCVLCMCVCFSCVCVSASVRLCACRECLCTLVLCACLRCLHSQF